MTVRVLKVTDEGKIVRENGDFVWLEDNDAITQLVRQKIKVFKGEWFLDLDLGIDYYGIIFPKASSDFARYLEFKRVVESVPGVISLVDFNIEVISAVTREYRITMNITADYGTIIFDEVI